MDGIINMKQRLKKDQKYLDILYLIVFGVLVCELFFHTTYFCDNDRWIGTKLMGDHATWDNSIYAIVITISVLRFQMQEKIDKKLQIIIGTLLIAFALHYFCTGMQIEMLAFAFLCVGACDISFDQLMKVYFYENIVLLIVTILAALAGFIENLEGGDGRMALGFHHPNTLGAHVLSLIVAYFLMKKTRIKWHEIGIAFIAEMVIFRICVSRSSMICAVGFLLICCLYLLYNRYIGKPTVQMAYKILEWLMLFSVFIFCGFSILASYLFSNDRKWMALLNKLFSGRLALGKIGFEKYNANLLGQPVKMIVNPKEGETYFYLDSFYVRNVFVWGMIALCAFMIFYFFLCLKAKKENQFFILSALSIFALHGIMEVCMSSVMYNPYMLFLLASGGTAWMANYKKDSD